MKKSKLPHLFLCLLGKLLFLASALQAQTVPAGSRKLSEAETVSLLPDAQIKALGIRYPLYAVFEYKDMKKTKYLVLAEHVYENGNKERKNDSVQALILRKDMNSLVKEQEIRDQIIPGKNNKGFTDFSIWFWTRYVSIADLDGDGQSDPVIVYGTSGDDGKEDGKIKIITLYKGKKYVIRQQNSPMDFDRNTSVDKTYYTLPAKIQSAVKAIMIRIMDDGNGIFPAGWEKAMKAKKIYFDEN